MSLEARRVISESDVIVGYNTYIELINEFISSDQRTYSTGMRGEVKRAKRAIELVLDGKQVAVVSSGDSGIYGMAGLLLEMIHKKDIDLDLEVVAGITSASEAASSLGAPLMNDFAAISLSNLMTPWGNIKNRLVAAAKANFVVLLYNPRSSSRTEQIKEARKIMLEYRDELTPVGIVWNAGREGEKVVLTNLRNMLDHKIDMVTTVIIGNSDTFISEGYMVTPRGYEL